MTKKEFEDKLYNGKFTERELEDLKWFDLDLEEDAYNDLKAIDELADTEIDRWTRPASFIFQYKDEYFCLSYQEGLTELQEDYYDMQPYKVKRVEKQVTIIDWEAIK